MSFFDYDGPDHLEVWYDHQNREWVLIRYDINGHKIGSTEYAATKKQMDLLIKKFYPDFKVIRT
jgi:hypothetical protein